MVRDRSGARTFISGRRHFRIPLLGIQIVLFTKDESAIWFESALHGTLFKGPNSPTVNGRRTLRLGLLSARVVTDAGVAFLTNDWNDNSKDITNFNAHANGTGTTAEAASQTALVTEVGTRVSGTKSRPAGNQLQSVATISQTATNAITEHGLLDSTTVSGSTLWDRSVFSAINVVNGDSIQFTYTLTVNSGG
jgi:hypothetical protein